MKNEKVNELMEMSQKRGTRTRKMLVVLRCCKIRNHQLERIAQITGDLFV
jgi:hypothetical protein